MGCAANRKILQTGTAALAGASMRRPQSTVSQKGRLVDSAAPSVL